MKSIISGSILAAAMAAISLPAMAEGTLDGLPGELSANVAFVNDYRFRGITQSDEDPAIQGGLDYSAELTEGFGLYIGAWGSSVDFNDGDEASIEIDGGFRREAQRDQANLI